tara:strand:+ start:147 stop:866 length:720 start_codon:yes stop_codon:yes gene_type:complete
MNEIAQIAIKGGRYIEAEEILNKELLEKPSSLTYFGLGVCKLNLLVGYRTVEEVDYCFQKSIEYLKKENKKLSKKKLYEFESQVYDISGNIIFQLENLHQSLERNKKDQSNAAMLGLALTIGAAAIGSRRSSNAFTQIASLVVAGSGVGLSLGGLKRLGDIPEQQKYIKTTIFSLQQSIPLMLESDSTPIWSQELSRVSPSTSNYRKIKKKNNRTNNGCFVVFVVYMLFFFFLMMLSFI